MSKAPNSQFMGGAVLAVLVVWLVIVAAILFLWR